MSWCWLALVDELPEDAAAAAVLSDPGHGGPNGRDAVSGAPAGVLAAWFGQRRPVPQALRADSRIVDPDGAAAAVSLVLPPRAWRIKFDDLAVQQARRDVLGRPPADAVTTLLFDASHFAGSLTVERGDPRRLRDDPFARISRPACCTPDRGCSRACPRPAGPRSSATAAPTRGRGRASERRGSATAAHAVAEPLSAQAPARPGRVSR